MSRVTIVVPCYNEAERLDSRAFQSFARDHDAIRFLFVNDGSRDATLEVLKALQRTNPERFDVYDLPKNVGKAEAVRRGMLYALADHPQYVGYWDADLATPLEAIPPFTEVLEARPELELICGARVRLLGRQVERRPIRHFLGRVFATAASCALRISIYDTQCGAKLFRASPEIQALFQEPFATRWIFDVEILARLMASGHGGRQRTASEVIYELPLLQWRDVPGSKIKLRDFARAAFELATISWKYKITHRQTASAKASSRLSGPHFHDGLHSTASERSRTNRQ